MADDTTSSSQELHDFLRPLEMNLDLVSRLSQEFYANFTHLAANNLDQFLPTPISESILRPVSKTGHGRHLAIDLGGTNLRVGFIELSGRQVPPPAASQVNNGCNDDASSRTSPTTPSSSPSVSRLKERSWPIADNLKSLNPVKLFDWIGECIASVVAQGVRDWGLDPEQDIPLGITFSFPMEQRSLGEAVFRSMGKGFGVGDATELGPLLLEGYDKARKAHLLNDHGPGSDASPISPAPLPPLRIVAIANDSVSTLVSFIYMCPETDTSRACMGLIVGTGCNATVPLRLDQLHESKRPPTVSLLPGESIDRARIAVNTEWSINGSAPPLRRLGLVTRWDDALDAAGENPGFQPLEYMTAGRYLGELGRLMLVDYLEGRVICSTSGKDQPDQILPRGLLTRHGLTTTFLSHFKPLDDPSASLAALEREFPPTPGSSFRWTAETAAALHRIAKAIEVRAAGILAAAIVALLKLSGDLPTTAAATNEKPAIQSPRELGVGYTGGCIAHFQDYLADTQRFLDDLVRLGPATARTRIVLTGCHDGGIKGAGILAAAAQSGQDRRT